MDSTSSVAGAAAQTTWTGTTANAAPATKTLGKDEFLKLLTAQLANQDPLQPVDNQAFIAQLAQFSSVEQLQNLGSRLDTLLLAQASSNQMMAASLVGKTVSFTSSQVALPAAGQPVQVAATSSAAAAVVAVVQDASGKTVRTLALGSQPAGPFTFSWDGRDDRGNALPAGAYGVKLTAKAADGSSVTVKSQGSGLVQGVSFDSGAAELVVNGVHVKMTDVVQVSQG
jgi:flagellar basal-body rod modification protein FlgD